MAHEHLQLTLRRETLTSIFDANDNYSTVYVRYFVTGEEEASWTIIKQKGRHLGAQVTDPELIQRLETIYRNQHQ